MQINNVFDVEHAVSSEDEGVGIAFKKPLPLEPSATSFVLMAEKVTQLESELAKEREQIIRLKEERNEQNALIADLRRQLRNDVADVSMSNTFDAKLRITEKRLHVPTGDTPYPSRKVNKVPLFNTCEGSTRYNNATKVFVMRLLTHGLSYNQVLTALSAIPKLLPEKCNLTVLGFPSKTTIKRYFVTLSILVKIHASIAFHNAGDLQAAVDETPCPQGHPIVVSVIRNLDNGENIVTGLRRMAGKRSIDYRRNEASIMQLLHSLLTDESFDFKTHFLGRLRLRGGDGASTENCYHKMLEKERSQSDAEILMEETVNVLPRLVCQLHATNTALRHIEKLLKDTSVAFDVMKCLAKHIGNRSPKNDRISFNDYLASKNIPATNIHGLTGTRFLEKVKNSAEILLLLQLVEEFVATLLPDSSFKKEFECFLKNEMYEHIRTDLTVIVVFNTFCFEPLYRSIVKVGTKVSDYRLMLIKILEIMRLDAVECFDLMRLGKNIPFVEEFFKPSNNQKTAIQSIDDYDDYQINRAITIVNMVKTQISDSVVRTSSVLIDDEMQLPENAILHNNPCESSFGMFDNINRTKSNLNFLLKETYVMAVKNKFFRYYDGLSTIEQNALLKKAQEEQERVLKLVEEDCINEEAIRVERANDLRNASSARLEAMAKKETELRKKLVFVPSNQAEYPGCLANYLEMSTANEWTFLKLLLQLEKIVDKKNHTASAFTVSHGGLKLSTAALRDKLFCLYI